MVTSYKPPVEGKSLTKVLITNWKSPVAKVRFSNIVHPFYYPNSPGIARYSVTVTIDPEEHKDFIQSMVKMEKSEKANTQFKQEIRKGDETNPGPIATGNSLFKFQLDKSTPIFKIMEGKPVPHTLEDELPRGSEIEVIFDISRYTNRTSNSYGISSRATKIIIHSLPEYKEEASSVSEDETTPF